MHLLKGIGQKYIPFIWSARNVSLHFQDVSMLFSLSVDGMPLINNTNLDWANLCKELLGVRPEDDAIEGNSLNWVG